MNGHVSPAASPIRIALMCENPLVYQTLGPRLSADPSLDVVGSYNCTIDYIPNALAHDPHVIIMGVSRITHFNKIVVQALRQAAPAVRIIMLPSYLDTPDDVPQASAAGADVVLEKSIDTPTLVEHIHTLLSQAI
jgi:DNA-binding NarL/FixJ family response regulator